MAEIDPGLHRDDEKRENCGRKLPNLRHFPKSFRMRYGFSPVPSGCRFRLLPGASGQ
jgi:hypothetical protein